MKKEELKECDCKEKGCDCGKNSCDDKETKCDCCDDECSCGHNEEESQIDFTNMDFSKIDVDKLELDELKSYFELLREQNNFFKNAILKFKEKFEEKTSEESKSNDESFLRLKADFENFKKRTAFQSAVAYNDGKSDVLKNIIEVVDNFERAIPTIKDESIKEGVCNIYRQFLNILANEKVSEIDALGKPFDPNFHNAVMQGEANSKEEIDTVCEVFQKGYMIGDKVLRHSVVKVAK